MALPADAACDPVESRSERNFIKTAMIIWIVFFAVLTVLALAIPHRSLIPLYSQASLDFWQGVQPKQDYKTGFYYLPASQILFTPFAVIGVRAAAVLWMLLSFALLSWSIREWARLLVPQRALLATSASLLLIIPGGAAALRIGQFDAPMWALIALAAAGAARGQKWAPALALTTALALKPPAIVAVLLMGAVWPEIGLRMMPLVFATLALPFACADSGYVWNLYDGLLDRIDGAVQVSGQWNDIAGGLKRLGFEVPFAVMLAIRSIMAVVALGAGLAARRRLPSFAAAFSVFAIAAIYLLLFNPRTEGGGYIGLAIVAGLLAARAWLVEDNRYVAAALAGCCLILGIPGLTPFTGRLLGNWMRPLLASLVLAFVVVPKALQSRLWDGAAADLDRQKTASA